VLLLAAEFCEGPAILDEVLGTSAGGRLQEGQSLAAFLAEQVPLRDGSCTWPLRVNTSDSPVDYPKIKKFYKERLS